MLNSAINNTFKQFQPSRFQAGKMKKDIILMGILAGLAFLISFTLSAPSLTMNDESITVNQIHQLYSGSDIIINEGKYGTMFTGETSAYYQKRNNYLAYSLFLPIISLPAMYLIDLTGDWFRLFFIFFFGIIGVLTFLGLFWLTAGTEYKLIKPLLIFSFLLFILFFLANICFYIPFLSGEDQPVETAAVVFTNGLLFSLMAPVSLALFKPFFNNTRLTVFSVILLLGSSSYMIWADTAKDHLAVAFLLLLLFYLYSKILCNSSPGLWMPFFMVSGLLVWARTEYGIFITVFLFCWYLLLFRKKIRDTAGNLSIKSYINSIFPGFMGLGIGIIPFLLNNLITTGNILIPPQYLYISGGNLLADTVADSLLPSSSLLNVETDWLVFLNHAINFIIPKDFQLINVFRIFFNPENGAAGIFFIAPLVIPGVFYYFLNYKRNCPDYPKGMNKMIKFSIIVIFIILFTYLRAITSSSINPGMFPDMRYFTPLYLPLNIIGIFLLYPVLLNTKKVSIMALIGSILFVPSILITIVVFILPNGIYNFINPLEKISWSLVLICVLVIFLLKDKTFTEKIIFILCIALVSIPIALQIIVMTIFGILVFDGYTFWMPVMEKVVAFIMAVAG